MNEYAYEVYLPVSDCGHDFGEAMSSHAKAIKLFEEEAKEQGIEVEVTSVEFLDFDSANSRHACAYFLIDYKAEKEVEM